MLNQDTYLQAYSCMDPFTSLTSPTPRLKKQPQSMSLFLRAYMLCIKILDSIILLYVGKHV